MSADPEAALATAVAIARAAGAVLREAFAGGPAAVLGPRHDTAAKTAAFDLVTEYDRRAEAVIVERLRAAFPDDAVIAEEGTGHDAAGARARWLVDPLDGTTNFAHGLPWFCVAIARVSDAAGGAGARVSDAADRAIASAGGAGARETAGRVDVGVVHAPVLDLTFTATRGGGAFCNGNRLAVTSVAGLDRAMLGTGFPSDRKTSPENNYAQFVAVKQRARAVRRLGSSALEQALVAAGTYDGFWDMKLKAWDLAAGSLLVEEAGGRVTGWMGEPLRLERGAVVATNGKIHDELLAILATVGLPSAVR
ncbi:MAG TPA: inositol monophosphatase family protein [Kofleriaceae bacterium]|nr:inositol monophosphatase family protein [Kofleriaceae bacterium]